MREDETGGTAMVLLHGWGARGDDLVSLARRLAGPGTRFFMPAGPLTEMGGGRSFWHLDTSDRPAYARNEEPDPGYQPHPPVVLARTAVQTILRTIKARYAPEKLIVGGFSQGAMLSLDIALTGAPAVDRAAILSGALLEDSLDGLKAPRASRARIFLSHGRQDPRLPFAGAERTKELLERHGFAVTFYPFEGGHQIPAEVVEALRTFLFAS
jgi:phospholipase/carboxylesterase